MAEEGNRTHSTYLNKWGRWREADSANQYKSLKASAFFAVLKIVSGRREEENGTLTRF